MKVRKALAFVASQQAVIKFAALLVGVSIVAAFVSLYVSESHFTGSVVAMFLSLVAAAISAAASLGAAKKIKKDEQAHNRRITPDRRHEENHAPLTSSR